MTRAPTLDSHLDGRSLAGWVGKNSYLLSRVGPILVGVEVKPIKLNLLENSYDFLNESLWAARLLGDRKERLLTSAISLERLADSTP